MRQKQSCKSVLSEKVLQQLIFKVGGKGKRIRALVAVWLCSNSLSFICGQSRKISHVVMWKEWQKKRSALHVWMTDIEYITHFFPHMNDNIQFQMLFDKESELGHFAVVNRTTLNNVIPHKPKIRLNFRCSCAEPFPTNLWHHHEGPNVRTQQRI